MRKANIFKRILSCMLVLTLILSGLGGIAKDNNVVEVEAVGDGSGYSVGGSPKGGTSAVFDSINDSGVRFSLVPAKLLTSGKNFKGNWSQNEKKTCYTANNIYKYLSSNIQYSILVTDFDKDKDVYCMPERGKYENSSDKPWVKQAVAHSLNDIFGKVYSPDDDRIINFPTTGQNTNTDSDGSFHKNLWVGNGHDLFKPNLNDNYFGGNGVFNRVLESGKKDSSGNITVYNSVSMFNSFKGYLKNVYNKALDSSVDSSNYVIVAEPVVISHVTDGTGLRKDTDVKGKYFSVSLQDCLYKDQKGSKWSYAFTQMVYSCSYETPERYIHAGSCWRTLLFNMKNYYFKFVDKNGVFIQTKENAYFKSGVALANGDKYWDTGFAVYSTNRAGGSTSAKTGVSYTLFSDNSADNVSQNINEVWGSLGTVTNTKSIKVSLDEDDDESGTNLSDTLDSGASNLAEVTYTNNNKEEIPNKYFIFQNNAVSSALSYQLTGKTKGNWKTKVGNTGNKYTNQGFGVVKIPYESAINKKVNALYKVTTEDDALNNLKTVPLVSRMVSVAPFSDCSLNFGNRYYVEANQEGSDNIVKAVANKIKSANPDFFCNDVSLLNTKVQYSVLGSIGSYTSINNLAMNGALYALKCSKALESLSMDANGSNGNVVSEKVERGTQKILKVDADGDIVEDENGNPIVERVEELLPDKSDLSNLGVSVMLMIPKKEVKSYIACASLNRDTGNVSKHYDTNVKYDVTESGVLSVPSNYKGDNYYAVIPNTSSYSLEGNKTGSTVFNSFEGNDEITSLDEFLAQVKSATGLTDNDIIACGENLLAGSTIRVGSTDRNVGAVKGYSIILLELKGSVTVKSELKLMDYELNYIYPSMLTNGKYGTLTDDVSYQTTSVSYVGCTNHRTITENHGKDKEIKATGNYAGNIINKNKTLDSNANKNILQYDAFTGGIFTTEYLGRTGHTFSNNLTNVRFSLAVNLIRSSFGDKRVISSLTASSIDGNYARDNLELTFGDKPNGMVGASAVRNSDATVGSDLNDLFEWDVKFKYSDCDPKNYRTDLISGFTTCPGHGDPKTYCTPTYWQETVNTEVLASKFGEKVRYKVKETAYKYQTDTLASGVNSTKTVADSLQKPTNGSGGTSSLISPYKIAVVHTSKSGDLSFYPEVEMRAYSSTGSIIANAVNNSSVVGNNRQAGGYVTPHNLLTMGEVLRKVNPSSMYVIRVNHKYDSGAEVSPAIKGSTISDSTAVGTNADAVSDGKPVIYAGGDVTVKVNPDFRLNMYGYSLDLIEPSDDGRYSDNSIKLRGYTGYTDIINGASNVKADWGNTYTSTDSKKEFDDWSKDILTKHLGVDMTLTVNGSGVDKVFNNFASSLGNMDTSASVAEGVYSIKIKEGKIVKDDVAGNGYRALISQIKSDYELSTDAEAEKIFTNSDIWQTISRAVEDSNDGFNNSQTASAISPRAHWYDEEVKTFVIRRYKKENLEIKNVLVNDKIDYGAAPTADDTTASLDSYKKADAKWYMTLYLKKDGAKNTPDGFSDSTVYYNPKDNLNKTGSANTGLTNASNSGSVLISEVYVDGADFVIPSASTYDMGN